MQWKYNLCWLTLRARSCQPCLPTGIAGLCVLSSGCVPSSPSAKPEGKTKQINTQWRIGCIRVQQCLNCQNWDNLPARWQWLLYLYWICRLQPIYVTLIDRHWMPSHPNKMKKHEKVPTWLDQAPTSASREAFHPSGIFHAFSRMRFLHFHEPRHPVISLATTPWQRVDVVTGHQLVISNPRFARHLRPLPCHSSLSIEGMKGQCHVASLTWWKSCGAKCENSEKLEKRSCRPVRSGMFLLAFVPAFDFPNWGTNTMARSRSAVLVTWITCSKLQMWSQVLQCVLQCVAMLVREWLDDVGCEQRWALVPVYVCLFTHTFTINLMRLISRPVTNHASLFMFTSCFCLTLKMWKTYAQNIIFGL